MRHSLAVRVRTAPAGTLPAALSALLAALTRCWQSPPHTQHSACGTRQVSAQRPLTSGGPFSALCVRRTLVVLTAPAGTRRATRSTRKVSALRPLASCEPRSALPVRRTLGVYTPPAGTLLASLSAPRAAYARCPHSACWRPAGRAQRCRAAHARRLHSARRHPAGCAKRSACGTLAPVVRITPASTLRAAHTAHAGIRLAARGTVRAAQVSAHRPLASCGSCSALCVRHARGVRTTPASSGTTAAAVRHTPGVCTSTAGTLRAALSALRARYPHSAHRQPAGRAQRYLCGNRLVSAQRPRHFAGQDSATRAAHAL